MSFPWPIYDTYGAVKDKFSWVWAQIPDCEFAKRSRGERDPLTIEGAFNDLMEGVRRVKARMNRSEPKAKFDECLEELEITKQLCLGGKVLESQRKILEDE